MVESAGYERRRAARYAMRIPIRVADVGLGSTVDVSSSGVAFMIEAGLEPGAVIDFLLTVEESDGPVILHCVGTVVRAEPRPAGIFAAATIEELVMSH